MGRYAIILVAGCALIFGVMRLRLNRVGLEAEEVGSGRYEQVASRNLANSGVELTLLQLKQNPSWRVGYDDLLLTSGQVDVEIRDAADDTSLGQDTLRIISTGTCGQIATTVQLMVATDTFDWPANVDAATTARCNVSTSGNMIIDGRDHDRNGNLIANNGVEGISTMQTFAQGGNSKIGGTTDAGVDVAPTKTGWGPVVDQNVVWPGGYPTTPDLVMGGAAEGFPEGTLKAIAQSGFNGSQYVTNSGLLTYPLSGVTYVELAAGGVWNPVSFGASSRGILIVHNSVCNAVIKNLNSGVFKGLIIADDIVHVHTQIIGAVFALSAGPSEGNCIGNGSGSILFSREAVSQSAVESGGGGSSLSLYDYWE